MQGEKVGGGHDSAAPHPLSSDNNWVLTRCLILHSSFRPTWMTSSFQQTLNLHKIFMSLGSRRAASDASAWPPSLFLLSLLLITPHTQASSHRDYTWSCTWRHRGMRELLKMSNVFILESCDIFSQLVSFDSIFKLPSALYWSSLVQRISVESENVCVIMHLSFVSPCFMLVFLWVACGYMGGRDGGEWGSGYILTLGSMLISLSHPQPSPASLGVSINNKSL